MDAREIGKHQREMERHAGESMEFRKKKKNEAMREEQGRWEERRVEEKCKNGRS